MMRYLPTGTLQKFIFDGAGNTCFGKQGVDLSDFKLVKIFIKTLHAKQPVSKLSVTCIQLQSLSNVQQKYIVLCKKPW